MVLDITRELTNAPVYPGDPAPRLEAVSRMAYGDSCNLSVLHACLHNGTHMDAPRHFVPDGADASAAFVFADAAMLLIGVEPQSVAPAACSVQVHKELLGAGVLLLEGLDLSEAAEGRYDLVAVPLKIAGADGTPVRAFLMPRTI